MTPLLQRLTDLVACNTQNPTGDEGVLADKLAADLHAVGASLVQTLTVGNHRSVFARFGTTPPRVLLNAHLDTVPVNHGYTRAPLRAVVEQGRCYGLGTADIKGAIAAVLDALRLRHDEQGPPDGIAVLFSGDEEHGSSCLCAFLADGHAAGISHAIVCEPTGCRVGHRHRGIGAAVVTATSQGGHSSLADELASPVVTLARVAVALDALGQRYRPLGSDAYRGICLNVASIDGGVAFNMVPTEARLTFSLRPGPGATAVNTLLDEAADVARKAAGPEPITFRVHTDKPAFQTRDLAAFTPLLGDLAQDPVDLPYWTEAALFSAAGIDAVVYGPGHVAQAHAADEYVDIAELERARDFFRRVIG